MFVPARGKCSSVSILLDGSHRLPRPNGGDAGYRRGVWPGSSPIHPAVPVLGVVLHAAVGAVTVDESVAPVPVAVRSAPLARSRRVRNFEA